MQAVVKWSFVVSSVDRDLALPIRSPKAWQLVWLLGKTKETVGSSLDGAACTMGVQAKGRSCVTL